MENKNNSLKIALTYIAIFFLVILIAIPPIFRIVFSNTKQPATNNNQNNLSKTVLHCTKVESIGTVSYNVQTFSTYSDQTLEKVIIRYTRTGEVDETNQNNQYETEIANLKSNSNITATTTTNENKFEITKDVLTTNSTDPVIGLYAKNIATEQEFLINNNYTSTFQFMLAFMSVLCCNTILLFDDNNNDSFINY